MYGANYTIQGAHLIAKLSQITEHIAVLFLTINIPFVQCFALLGYFLLLRTRDAHFAYRLLRPVVLMGALALQIQKHFFRIKFGE